jgi:hypothetical protein
MEPPPTKQNLFVADSEESGSEPRDPLELQGCGNLPGLGYYLAKARETESPLAKYVCAACGCCFLHVGALDGHLRSCAQALGFRRLDSEARFPCYSCKKVYLSRTSLNRHRRANCPGARIATCGICDQEFPTHYVMMLHREQHFRDKPSN